MIKTLALIHNEVRSRCSFRRVAKLLHLVINWITVLTVPRKYCLWTRIVAMRPFRMLLP